MHAAESRPACRRRKFPRPASAVPATVRGTRIAASSRRTSSLSSLHCRSVGVNRLVGCRQVIEQPPVARDLFGQLVDFFFERVALAHQVEDLRLDAVGRPRAACAEFRNSRSTSASDTRSRPVERSYRSSAASVSSSVANSWSSRRPMANTVAEGRFVNAAEQSRKLRLALRGAVVAGDYNASQRSGNIVAAQNRVSCAIRLNARGPWCPRHRAAAAEYRSRRWTL